MASDMSAGGAGGYDWWNEDVDEVPEEQLEESYWIKPGDTNHDDWDDDYMESHAELLKAIQNTAAYDEFSVDPVPISCACCEVSLGDVSPIDYTYSDYFCEKCSARRMLVSSWAESRKEARKYGDDPSHLCSRTVPGFFRRGLGEGESDLSKVFKCLPRQGLAELLMQLG